MLGIRLNPAMLTAECNGATHKLRPKTYSVLNHLLVNRDRTVGKQELLQAVWGEVAVTDDVLVQSIAELRKILEEDRSQPQVLITVPKLGYRLLAEPLADPPIAEPAQERRRRWPAFAMAATLAVGVLGIGWYARNPAAPAHSVIAVLPLENLSGSKDLDWLRDGIAGMLITGLSQSQDLTVLSLDEVKTQMARQRSLTGSATVIKGSFATSGGQLRVDLQILDNPGGRVTGGDSLTVPSVDRLLTEVDTLRAAVATRLGATPAGGSVGGALTANLEAYRQYSLGLEKAAGFRNREAIELFQRAVQLDPDFAMAHARIGYAYAVTWNLAQQARPHLERAYKLSHRLTHKDRMFIEGWYAIANLDFPRAVATFQTLVQRYPGESEAHVRLGLLLQGEERLADALSVARDGALAFPDEPEFYELEARALAQMGRHEGSITAARKYAERVPAEPKAHDLLGEMQQWAGHSEEALASYRRALELAPDFERPVVHIGNLYFQLGRYREAIEQYQRYIAMAPSELEQGRGWGRIAWVWWRKGDIDQASQAAAKELRMVPSAVWNSIVLALHRGDQATVTELRKRLDNAPFTSRGARTGLRYREYFEGYIALKQGHKQEALERLQKAVHRPPPFWSMESYEDCLADALFEIGKHDAAIAEYRRALRMNPGNGLARYRLAQALRLGGHAADAEAEKQVFARQWKAADSDLPEVSALKQASF